MGIDPQPHGERLVAPDVDPADPGDGLQALGEELVGEALELEQRAAVAADRDLDDRRLVVVRLRDRRRVDVGGEVPHRPRHPVADVVGRVVDIPVQLEFQDDAGTAVQALGTHGLDSLESGQPVLDQLREVSSDGVVPDLDYWAPPAILQEDLSIEALSKVVAELVDTNSTASRTTQRNPCSYDDRPPRTWRRNSRGCAPPAASTWPAP